MALNNMGLGFLFTAKNLASGKVRGLRNDFTGLRTDVDKTRASFTRNIATMGAGIAGLAAGGLLLAGQFKLAKAAGEFEQGLAAVGAVTRATSAELKGLENAAIQAGIATQFSPKEAVEGLTSLATAGQSAQQATATLIPVLDLAAGSLGQLGVAGSAEAVVGTLNAYGIAAENAGAVTDKLLRTTQLTNFQAKDFSIGLAKAAAAGATFGQSLEDTLIVVGQLRNMNIEASSSATAYREATRRLAADQNAQAAVTKLGVDIYDKQTGAIRPMINVIQDMGLAMGDVTEKERNATIARAFGARGLLAFNAVMKATATRILPDGTKQTLKGADAIAHLRGELGKAGGTAKEFKERLLDTFQGQLTLARGSVQTFITVVGKDMATAIRPAVEKIIAVLNTLIVRWQALSQDTRDSIGRYISLAGVILMMGGAATLLAGALPLLGRALGAVRVAALAVGRSFLALSVPIGVVVGAALLIRQAYMENLGGFADWVDGWVDRIRLAWNGLTQIFTQGGFSGAVREEFGKAENQGIKQFVIGVGMLLHRFKALWAGVMEGFAQAWESAQPALIAVGKAVGGVFSAVERLFGALLGGKSVVGESSATWKAFGTTVALSIGKVFEFIAAGVEVALGLVERFTGGVASVFENLGSPIDNLVSGFDHIWSAVKKVGGIFSDLMGGTGDLRSFFGDFAEFLGGAFGLAIKGVALVFEGIGVAIEGVVDFIQMAINYFGKLKDVIWEDFPGIATFFDETLPAAFMDFSDAIDEWVVQPVLGLGKAIGDALKDAIDQISSILADIVLFLPARYLPDELVSWAKTVTGSDKSGMGVSGTPENWVAPHIEESVSAAHDVPIYTGRATPETPIFPAVETGVTEGGVVEERIIIQIGDDKIAEIVASRGRDRRIRQLEQEEYDLFDIDWSR